MRYIVLFLAGCGTIDITYDTTPCENVDLGSEADIFAERDGEDVHIYRMPVFVGDTSVFVPELSFDGTRIFVRERWVEPEPPTAELCLTPTVQLIQPPERSFTIEWYLGDSVIPDYVVPVDVKSL